MGKRGRDREREDGRKWGDLGRLREGSEGLGEDGREGGKG